MALTIETGAVVASANSFASLVEIKAYALQRGVTLPNTDPAIEVLAVNAWDFLLKIEDRMKGTRVEGDGQEGPYPRSGVYLFNVEVAETEIPSVLKKAQCQLVCDQARGVKIVADDTAEQAVKREKTGPLETEYFDAGALARSPELAVAMAHLAPLLRVGFGLRTERA